MSGFDKLKTLPRLEEVIATVVCKSKKAFDEEKNWILGRHMKLHPKFVCVSACQAPPDMIVHNMKGEKNWILLATFWAILEYNEPRPEFKFDGIKRCKGCGVSHLGSTFSECQICGESLT